MRIIIKKTTVWRLNKRVKIKRFKHNFCNVCVFSFVGKSIEKLENRIFLILIECRRYMKRVFGRDTWYYRTIVLKIINL